MRNAQKIPLSEERSEFNGKYLTKEQMTMLQEYYKPRTEPRWKEFLEMFFFSFYACELRIVEVMTCNGVIQLRAAEIAENYD